MRDWIDTEMTSNQQVKREERKIGGGGRISSGNAKRTSLSPVARLKKRGEEFLKRIETLKEDLKLEGKQLQNI